MARTLGTGFDRGGFASTRLCDCETCAHTPDTLRHTYRDGLRRSGTNTRTTGQALADPYSSARFYMDCRARTGEVCLARTRGSSAKANTRHMMFLHKLKNCCLTALPTAWKSTAWLLKLMIPISLAITILQHTGLLAKIALCLHPLFVHLGLPGASAVAFLSGATAGTYAGIAAMMSMPLTMKQATILSMMIALCHALPMECAVNRMTGSSFWKMATIRVLMAGLCGLLLNPLLPAADAAFIYLGAPADSTFQEVCITWMISQVKM